jgi:hypothetical protein
VAELTLQVLRIELKNRAGAWIKLPVAQGAGLTLLRPDGAPPRPWVDQAAIPAGDYDSARILFGSGHRLKLRRDDALHTLTLASQGYEMGTLPLKVAPGAPADLWFRVDCAQSLRETPPGSGAFVFQPVLVKGQDKTGTGAIAGRITDAVSHAPLAGVTVRAQDPHDLSIQYRTVTTGDDGSYTLDLLPLDRQLRVITQPATAQRPTAPTVYATQISKGFLLVAQARERLDFSCKPLPHGGGAVEGTSSWGDSRDLRSHEVFLVLEGAPTERSGITVDAVIRHLRMPVQGPFRFDSVPPGRYKVVANTLLEIPGSPGKVALAQQEGHVSIRPGSVAHAQLKWAFVSPGLDRALRVEDAHLLHFAVERVAAYGERLRGPAVVAPGGPQGVDDGHLLQFPDGPDRSDEGVFRRSGRLFPQGIGQVFHLDRLAVGIERGQFDHRTQLGDVAGPRILA